MRLAAIACLLVGCGAQQRVELNGHAYTAAEIEQGNAWLPNEPGCELPDVVFLSREELEARFGELPGGYRRAGYYHGGTAFVVGSSDGEALWPFRRTKYVHELAHHVQACRGVFGDASHEATPELWRRVEEFTE